MDLEKLLIILVAIVIIAIVVSVIKNAIKFIIFVVVALLAVVFIRGVMAGKTPEEVFVDTKADAVYTKQLYEYSQKVKKSVDITLDAIDNKSLDKIKEENEKLHEYLEEVSDLYHGENLKGIHKKYCGYLESIVKSSDAILASGNLKENTLSNLEKVKGNLNSYLEDLLKIEVK
ncbi:hypothetical protein GCM10008905_14400 [Clostridium malenominatum]|uniref:Uncharacterized protein n=1 Tax=Clostridium malenominatum TaxID=1539 RepID=A0ABN1IW67_9CLOT